MPNWYTINHPTTLHTHNETETHCCSPMALCAAGCILPAKLPSLNTQPPPGSPKVTILSASSVRTLVQCAVKYSRPPDLKSSSNVSLLFAWITGPATDPSFSLSFSSSVIIEKLSACQKAWSSLKILKTFLQFQAEYAYIIESLTIKAFFSLSQLERLATPHC